MLLHLNFHSSEGNSVTFYNTDYSQESFSVKISSSTCSSVVVKDYAKDSHNIHKQGDFGVKLHGNHFVTFELIIEDDRNLILNIHLFVNEKCVGVSYLTSNQFKHCTGSVSTVLICPKTCKLTADISCDYIFIKPWQDSPLLSHMKRQNCFNGKFFYMGHRGCGKTYDRSAPVLENTINSFMAAQELGATMVELDIVVTKDHKPVIFHDFTANVFMENNLVEVPVTELTLEQVKNMKMDFARDGAGSNYDKRFASLFPTLEEFLIGTPESLGVMIEVKFPYKDGLTGQLEVAHYFQRNEVVDLVLDVVMRYNGNRHIVFGSFDPDVCLMLHYKQSRYHVMLISCGENNKYAYMDIRNRTRGIAAHFALTYDLLGISLMSNPLLGNNDEIQSLVKLLRENGKHIITWGSTNSDPSFADIQQTFGISAIISDNLEKMKLRTVDN